MDKHIEVIGIDHGWSNMKTVSHVFTTGVNKITTEPAFFDNIVEHNQVYYKVGGKRLEVRDLKVENDNFYILTLASAAKELNRRGMRNAYILLAVGLPLTRFGAEKHGFIEYLGRNKEIEFQFEKEHYRIKIARANTYTITFHPNGGSGTMESIICQYDQTYTLPSMVFMPPTHPCTYLGWNTDSSSFSASYGENQQIRNLTDIDGYTFDFYAIWDYAPDLECKNRYFTLYEARNGMITEEELLRTAVSTDREDGTTVIRVKDYSDGVFTSLSASTEIIITYTTTDSRHNVTEKRAVVTIVDTEDTAEGPMDFDGRKKYARFIDGEYWQNSYEHGGLEETSWWRQDVTYWDTLVFAMNNVRGEDGEYRHVQQVWEFTWEEIGQVKKFVKEKGMGNSVDESALMQFVARFGGCRKS